MELNQSGDRLLRLNQIVPAIIPVSKSNWWAGVKSGLYPPGFMLGPRTHVWRESEIQNLIANKKEN